MRAHVEEIVRHTNFRASKLEKIHPKVERILFQEQMFKYFTKCLNKAIGRRKIDLTYFYPIKYPI